MSFLKKILGPTAADLTAAQAALPRNLPFELTAVRGKNAVAEWQSLRTKWHPQGFSPVVLGDAQNVAAVFENFGDDTETSISILEAAQAISAEQFLTERKLSDDETGELSDEASWPRRAPPAADFTIHREILTGKPKEIVFIARLPTVTAHAVPALLKFGGWNDCPDPATHAALLRHWEAIYGLEIYGLTSDILECHVARPPTTREAVLQLAREQYAYCPDIVDQGTESLPLLAAALLNSPAWYFWWD